MSFRKEFAILGVIFAVFIFGSMAFPGGVVESVSGGTQNIPGVQSVGGWVDFGSLLLIIALGMLCVILMTCVVLAVIMTMNLNDVAEAYGVDVDGLRGLTPMQAAEMLNDRRSTHDQIIESANEKK